MSRASLSILVWNEPTSDPRNEPNSLGGIRPFSLARAIRGGGGYTPQNIWQPVQISIIAL